MKSINSVYVLEGNFSQSHDGIFPLSDVREQYRLLDGVLKGLGVKTQMTIIRQDPDGETETVSPVAEKTPVTRNGQEVDQDISSFLNSVGKGDLPVEDFRKETKTRNGDVDLSVNWASLKNELVGDGDNQMSADEFKEAVSVFLTKKALRGIKGISF